jgi:hypothetical protein
MNTNSARRTLLTTFSTLRVSSSLLKRWLLSAFIIFPLVNVLPGCCHQPQFSEWSMPDRVGWLILKLQAIGHVGFEATENRFAVDFRRGLRPDIIVMNIHYFGSTDKTEDVRKYEGQVSRDVSAVYRRVQPAFHNSYGPSNNFVLVVRVECLGGNVIPGVERLDKMYYTGVAWDKENVKEILKVGEDEFMQREIFDKAR